ncbi:MAG: methyltransferase domain-containing protein [Acidimicrobiales bacterium]
MPPAPPPPSSVAGAPEERDGAERADAAEGPESSEQLEAAARTRHLEQVIREIGEEVERRRASGDLPASLESELDAMFLEFSPVGLQAKSRMRQMLALVDRSAYIDLAVPVASRKVVGRTLKRLIKAGIGWYMGFVVHQIIRFGWSVSRLFHVLVDRVEDLERSVERAQDPGMPRSVVPRLDVARQWWVPEALRAMTGIRGRVLHGECGNGTFVVMMTERGIDAYGVDPDAQVGRDALDPGVDLRSEPLIDHLELVEPGALAGIVLTGSVQWLPPGDRRRLVDLLSTRMSERSVLVLQSMTPEAWSTGSSPIAVDLAPGRPLHPETWIHLLQACGFSTAEVVTGGQDRRIDPVGPDHPGATSVNGAIDAVNRLLLGPEEYLVVASR